MPAERITLHRTNVDKTEVIEQYPKTIAGQVYDFENEKFLDATLSDFDKRVIKIENQGYSLEDFILQNETSHENAFIRASSAIRQKALETNFRDIPQLKVPAGYYTLKSEVKLSPMVKMKAEGQVKFLVDFPGTGFWISPEDDDTRNGDGSLNYDLRKNSWNRGQFFDGSNGGFIFTTNFPTEAIAVEIGRRVKPQGLVNDFFPVSRYVVNNINIYNFDIGLKLNMIDHYLGRFENLHIEGCRTNIKFQEITTDQVYAGENFVFDGGVLASSGYRGIGYCVDIDAPAVDVLFNDISFDFNKNSTVRVGNSGCNVRFNHCYFEDGDDSKGFYELQNMYPNQPSFNAMCTVSFSKCFSLQEYPMPIITNTPYINNGNEEYIILNCNVDGFDLKYHGIGDLSIEDNRFAVKGKSIRLYDKKLSKQGTSPMVHSYVENNYLVNGDFTLTPVGTDIFGANADPYWVAYYFTNLSNLTTVQDGTKRSIQYDVGNTTSNGVGLRYKQMIAVLPGDLFLFSFIYKTDKISSATDITFGFDCYDDLGNQMSNVTYLTKNSNSSTVIDNDSNKYYRVRNIPLLKVPKNTFKIRPFVAIANVKGTFFRVTDVFLDKIN